MQVPPARGQGWVPEHLRGHELSACIHAATGTTHGHKYVSRVCDQSQDQYYTGMWLQGLAAIVQACDKGWDAAHR